MKCRNLRVRVAKPKRFARSASHGVISLASLTLQDFPSVAPNFLGPFPCKIHRSDLLRSASAVVGRLRTASA